MDNVFTQMVIVAIVDAFQAQIEEEVQEAPTSLCI